MPFVQGKCENCGGILAVDSALKAAICPFCGVAYVVQDSINYYSTTVKVDTINANVVNVSDESSAEGRLKAADAYMKIGKYTEAENEYKKVTELTPQNHLGWLGLIEAQTQKYTKRVASKSEIEQLEDYAKSVMTFAPNNVGESLLQEYRAYINSEIIKNNNEISVLDEDISKHNYELNKTKDENHTYSETLIQYQTRISLLEKYFRAYQTSGNTAICWIIGLLLSCSSFFFLLIAMSYGKGYVWIILLSIISSILLFFAVKGTLKNKRSKKEYNTLCHEEIELKKLIQSSENRINYLNNEIKNRMVLREKYN